MASSWSACRGPEIQGFVAGVLQQEGFYRRAIRGRMCAFAAASFRSVLRQPRAAARLVRALRKPGRVAEPPTAACLMSIAVNPACARAGIGKRLTWAFCDELKRRGAPAVCLTTDRDDNASANSFYQKLGFRLIRTFVTPEGRAMNEYVISVREFTEDEMRGEFLPYFLLPLIGDQEVSEVLDTLRSDWITTGPKVRRLRRTSRRSSGRRRHWPSIRALRRCTSPSPRSESARGRGHHHAVDVLLQRSRD